MRSKTLIASLVVAGFCSLNQALSEDSADKSYLERCRAIPEAATRLRCYEELTPERTPQPPAGAETAGKWRMVRAPSQDRGNSFISMMRTADLRSDPDFAGLAIHCGQHGPELVLVVIQPLPPRTHPQVTLGDPDKGTRVEASVLPSGAALLLPDEAMTLAKGPWQSLPDLTITIENGETKTHGVVQLEGLGAALQTLSASCPTK